MGWTFWKEKSITFLLAAFVQSAFLHPFFHSFRCECHSLQLYLKAVAASPYAFEMHSIAPPFLSFRWFCKLRKMRSVWMHGIQQISQRTICAHSCQITKRNMKCKRNECTMHIAHAHPQSIQALTIHLMLRARQWIAIIFHCAIETNMKDECERTGVYINLKNINLWKDITKTPCDCDKLEKDRLGVIFVWSSWNDNKATCNLYSNNVLHERTNRNG